MIINAAKRILKRILNVDRWRSRRVFLSDEKLFWEGTHSPFVNSLSHYEARVTVLYHIIEKGLTMPQRRLGFGKEMISQLMSAIEQAKAHFKEPMMGVDHAIGVVKAYLELHQKSCVDTSHDKEFWGCIEQFVARFPDVPVARQFHFSRDQFYIDKESPFPLFVRSRHTIRHYSDEDVPLHLIRKAVSLAAMTPSACNRHHARVRCISNHGIAQKILTIQGGNRGFGHLANKVLIVTSDLSVEMSALDRYDPYVNGGMFLMSLCYSLHYYGIAHCILSCSIDRQKIAKIKELGCIPHSETLVAMLSCGFPPPEFDVAASPCKPVDDIFSVVE